MRKHLHNENGMVLLESVLAISLTIIILAFLLAFGFYLYQKTMVRIVVNEIAEETVQIYKYRNAKSASSICIDDITGVGKYRSFLYADSFKSAAKSKALTRAKERLPRISLAKASTSPEITIDMIGDDLGRSHYSVTLKIKYKYMLGDLLKYVGLKSAETIEATAIVESVDISQYVNTVKLANYGIKKFEGAVPFLEMVSTVIKMMNTVYGVFK